MNRYQSQMLLSWGRNGYKSRLWRCWLDVWEVCPIRALQSWERAQRDRAAPSGVFKGH